MKVPEIAKVLGENVRRRRKELGLTQRDLADRAALFHPVVSNVERAQSSVTIATVAKLAAALETSVADLFQEAGVPA